MLNVQFNDLSEFLIDWNNFFPYDRIYRKKFNIKFCSKEHKELSYIDIILELLEDSLFEKHIIEKAEKLRKQNEYESTGKWINNFNKIDSEKDKNDLFDKLDITLMQNQQLEQSQDE
jgi:hypothetical protein